VLKQPFSVKKKKEKKKIRERVKTGEIKRKKRK
jgi:hypothetical protein